MILIRLARTTLSKNGSEEKRIIRISSHFPKLLINLPSSPCPGGPGQLDCPRMVPMKDNLALVSTLPFLSAAFARTSSHLKSCYCTRSCVCGGEVK